MRACTSVRAEPTARSACCSRDDAPDGFNFWLARTVQNDEGDDAFQSPRHKHTFQQIKFAERGAIDVSPGQYIQQGELGYFPKGAYYGPQHREKGLTSIVCQYGFNGEHQRGDYWESRRGEVLERLKARGTFEDGLFLERNPDSGEVMTRDSVDALYDERYRLLKGKPLVIPEPTYDAPILIHPTNSHYYDAAPGVEVKQLGRFFDQPGPDGDVRLSMVRLKWRQDRPRCRSTAARLDAEWRPEGGRSGVRVGMRHLQPSWRASAAFGGERAGTLSGRVPPARLTGRGRARAVSILQNPERDMAATTNAEVLFYWVPGCANCTRLKGHLTSRGVSYRAINVQSEPAILDVIAASGSRALPAIRVGDRWVAADEDQLDRAFGFSPLSIRPPSAVEMVQRCSRMLDLAADLAEQLPPDHYDDPTPTMVDFVSAGRFLADGQPFIPHGTFKSLVHHLAQHGEKAWRLVLASGGRHQLGFAIDGSGDYSFFGEPEPGTPMYRVARSMRLTAGDLLASSVERADADFARPLATHRGERTMLQYLKVQTVGLLQHTRQLVGILEDLRVVPAGRVADEDLAGLNMPAGLWD